MRRLAPTLLVLVVLLACAGPASAATGDLTFKDCIAKFVSAPCTEVPNQLLEGGFEVAVSPNGNFVYVADGNDSVVGFTRLAADGSLAFQGCVDNGDDVGCTHLPKSLLMVVRGLAGDVGVLAGREIEPLDGVQVGKDVERPEDGGPTDPQTPGSRVRDEIGRGEGSVPSRDEIRDRTPSARPPIAGVAERGLHGLGLCHRPR